MQYEHGIAGKRTSAMQGMELILTAKAQREADRQTIEQFGLPGITLMETAGRAAAAQISKAVHPVAGKHVCIVAGRGNNGGDGFVVARVLYSQGARVQVCTAGQPDEMSPDAAHHWRLLESIAVHAESDALLLGSLDEVESSRADIYVDALLGTGLARPLRSQFARIVNLLNSRRTFVASIDIATGLHADTGIVLGQAVRADLTVTMGARKPGHLLGQGPHHSGQVVPVPIGIPEHVVRNVQRDCGAIWLSTDASVRAILPRRRRDAHKYSVGMLLVIGGSPGLTGAAVMASRAAARAGAGYVMCATHASVQSVLAGKLTATATCALPESTPGNLDPAAANQLMEGPLRKAKALLIGPGLGRSTGTQAVARAILQASHLPAVIDADGLFGWAEGEHEIALCAQGKWILTPHAGEMARLTGQSDFSDRIGNAKYWARRWNAVLVAKGAPSLVATPQGTVYICSTGNSALATAGTGDILAGLCGGLLAQGLSPAESAIAALHIGGLCAEDYCQMHAAQSMTATDMLTSLPRVMKALGM